MFLLKACEVLVAAANGRAVKYIIGPLMGGTLKSDSAVATSVSLGSMELILDGKSTKDNKEDSAGRETVPWGHKVLFIAPYCT